MTSEDLDALIAAIRADHRGDREAIKQISRIERGLEAFIRVNVFGFSTMAPEKERLAISKKAVALVKAHRDDPDLVHDWSSHIRASLASVAPWNVLHRERQKGLAKLAKQLPAASFVENVRGFGLVGFAQIIGETGNLSNYAGPAKVWKRLGFAPYEGLAMSSWRRETWRPYALSAEEWVANPFKAERYAIIFQIGESLFKAQGVGKDKSPTGKWEPSGPYGEIYARRRAHTAVTHPDWSDMHSMRDGLRIMMKELIRALWCEWRQATLQVNSHAGLPAAPIGDEGSPPDEEGRAELRVMPKVELLALPRSSEIGA